MVTETLNPVTEIERAVQARARLGELNELAADTMENYVAEEIERWRLDFKMGRRSVDLPDPRGVARRVIRNLTGFGPLTDLLADDDVWEIMINAPDAIFVKRHQGPSGYHHEAFHDDDHVSRTITKLLDQSTTAHRKLDPSEGLQDAQLDDGARLHIVHGDVARGGHLMVNIRKFTGVPFRDLDELTDRSMMTTAVATFLKAVVDSRQTIVFAGAPGSGKTTLLSCCCGELDPTLRVVTAEEVFEADIPVANVASMQTRPARADREPVDLRRLVAGFLRMSPDVAVVGEVRDREALPLLLTLSSGVKGFTTIHAGSATRALTRLRFICQLSDSASEMPMSALTTLVSEAVDLVVHLVRTDLGPRVSSIVAVEDLATSADSGQFTTTEVFARDPRTGILAWTGNLPIRLGHALELAGHDPRRLLDDGLDPLGRGALRGSRMAPS